MFSFLNNQVSERVFHGIVFVFVISRAVARSALSSAWSDFIPVHSLFLLETAPSLFFFVVADIEPVRCVCCSVEYKPAITCALTIVLPC